MLTSIWNCSIRCNCKPIICRMYFLQPVNAVHMVVFGFFYNQRVTCDSERYRTFLYVNYILNFIEQRMQTWKEIVTSLNFIHNIFIFWVYFCMYLQCIYYKSGVKIGRQNSQGHVNRDFFLIGGERCLN